MYLMECCYTFEYTDHNILSILLSLWFRENVKQTRMHLLHYKIAVLVLLQKTLEYFYNQHMAY
jgi:hypothetical protein